MRRFRAAVLFPFLASLPACALIELPFRLIAAVVSGVFRLGSSIVDAGGKILGGAARAIGPYVVFWAASAPDPAKVPAPADVEIAVVRAGREKDPLREGLADALARAPAGAEAALLVPVGTALAPDAADRIAVGLRGRRLLGVAFVARPGPALPPSEIGNLPLSVHLLAPAAVAPHLVRAGFPVVAVPDF